MNELWIIFSALGVLIVLACLCGAAYGRSRPQDPLGPLNGLVYLIGRHYAKSVHQLRVTVEPGAFDDLTGPLIVVCNHTAGVDPILVSISMPSRVRWLMADDMRVPWLNWFWKWHGIIFIARNRHGRAGIRNARKHLHAQGIIGIFPEGRIERPARTLLPFASGVGVLVRRTGARVLPVVIEGTPQTEPAWNALWTASNSSVYYHEPIDYAGMNMDATEITADLEARFKQWTGWEMGPSRRPLNQPDAQPRAKTDPSGGLENDEMPLARNIA